MSEKHDYIAVGERVHMVFDATIRQLDEVGLMPGAGLKRFEGYSKWENTLRGTVYAALAVVLQ